MLGHRRRWSWLARPFALITLLTTLSMVAAPLAAQQVTPGASPGASPVASPVADGGDGYPDLSVKATTRDVLDQVVADYIAGSGATQVPGATIEPAIQARITCTGEGCPQPAQ